MEKYARREPLTEEDILDMYDAVKRLQNSLEDLFGALYDNEGLPEAVREEIRTIYEKKF